MSDYIPIDSPRILLSPFNGEAWTVPPDVSDELYRALIERGFKPIPPKPKRKEDLRASR
jgi:hypothetical protein